MEECPFPDVKVTDWKFLDEDTSSRTQCSKCGKSRKYYCYSCQIPLSHLASKVPKVKLPIHVDIIKHPNEIDGKSTSSHAVILSPEDVTIYTYPCIPDYDCTKVLLVFPCEDSVTLEDIANEQVTKLTQLSEDTASSNAKMTSSDSPDESSDSGNKAGCKRKHSESEDGPSTEPSKCPKVIPFEKVVFVDSTWNQTHNLTKDERLKGLRKVELKTRTTNFWRCQEGTPKTYLSTIEAIYYFIVDLHKAFISNKYGHEYDDLLFFFCHMYEKIKASSKGGKDIKAYQRK